MFNGTFGKSDGKSKYKLKMLKRIKKIFGLYKNIDDVLITPYRSYGTQSHIYLLGRALDDVPLKIVEDQSLWKTLKNTYKQFDSFEISEA